MGNSHPPPLLYPPATTKSRRRPTHGNHGKGKYGLISSTGNLMINIVADAAYSTTVENQTTYYVRYNNEAIDIVKYIREQQNGTNQVENNYGDATVSVENNIASEQ